MGAQPRWRLRPPGEGASEGDLRRLFIVLGLPAFGLAFAFAVLTTYGPVLLLDITDSPALVGALLGGEGALALALPLISGALSDRMSADSHWGKRLPFIVLGAPLVLAGLVLLPLIDSILLAGVALGLFFVGYYLYYPPYRAVYADVLPRSLFARAQATQAILRGAGLGFALITGGLLLAAWKPLPFVVGGSLVGLTILAFPPVLHLQDRKHAPIATTFSIRGLLADPALRLFATVNMLLELSFAGLRTFIVLYVTEGLGRSPGIASAVIGVVAAAYILGAPLAAHLERRFGIANVMTWSAILYGVGLCAVSIPTTLTPALVLLPFVALSGAVLLTLPQALAFLLAPAGAEGIVAGIIDVSRGLGVVLGPLMVGYAVRYSGPLFPGTNGYAAMWPVIGLATLLAVPLLRRLRPVGPDQWAVRTRK